VSDLFTRFRYTLIHGLRLDNRSFPRLNLLV
jgi:hypothetical protein